MCQVACTGDVAVLKSQQNRTGRHETTPTPATFKTGAAFGGFISLRVRLSRSLQYTLMPSSV
jgi:hypothetical protein